jgi:mono/diheme cytochrome c family protein
MRWFLVAPIALVLMGVFAFAALAVWPMAPAATIVELKGDAKRGAYLARLSGCVTCHTTSGGTPFAGGSALVSRFGSFYAPNVTPHPEQGIGDWTFAEFVRAVRQGISPEGKPYYPAFPYEFYAPLTDRDMADLWSAFQALPPSDEPSVPHEVGFPFNIREGLKVWKSLFEQPLLYQNRPDRSAEWNRGKFIVEGPAHCGACHTPRNLIGGLVTEDALSGDPAMMDGGKSPPITKESLAARGFTKESLIAALRTGVLPDGDSFGGSMAEVVRGSTTHLLTQHLDDIATYLLDLDE